MIKLGKFRIYTGSFNWGWNMFGIGWGNKWFLGFSLAGPEKLRRAVIDLCNSVNELSKTVVENKEALWAMSISPQPSVEDRPRNEE